VVPFLLAWLSLALAVFPTEFRLRRAGPAANRPGRSVRRVRLDLPDGPPTGTGIGIWALAAAACLPAAGGSLVIRAARGEA